MAFPASINGKCANGDRIAKGDLITKAAPKGWAHADCDATGRDREREAHAAYTEYAEEQARREVEAHAFDGDPIAELLYNAYAGLGASDSDGYFAPVARSQFAKYDRATQRSWAEVTDANLDERIAAAEHRVEVTYDWLPRTMDYSDYPAERTYAAAVRRRDALLALKAS